MCVEDSEDKEGRVEGGGVASGPEAASAGRRSHPLAAVWPQLLSCKLFFFPFPKTCHIPLHAEQLPRGPRFHLYSKRQTNIFPLKSCFQNIAFYPFVLQLRFLFVHRPCSLPFNAICVFLSLSKSRPIFYLGYYWSDIFQSSSTVHTQTCPKYKAIHRSPMCPIIASDDEGLLIVIVISFINNFL